MESLGKLTLFPNGRLKSEDRQLQERLDTLLYYCKSDQQRCIENPGISLDAFLDHLRRLPQLASHYRDAIVVLTRPSPFEALQTRDRLTQAYPDLSMARWIVCHIGQDSRDLHELGVIDGEMDDLPLWKVRDASCVIFTPAYKPSAATPIRLQRIEGQIASASSQRMPSVKYEETRTQSGSRIAIDLTAPLVPSHSSSGRHRAVTLLDPSDDDQNKKP